MSNFLYSKQFNWDEGFYRLFRSRIWHWGRGIYAGDVYSFGILLLEMIIGRRPTNEMFSDGLNLHMFAKMAIPERVMQILDTELLMAEETTMMAEGHPNKIGRHNRRGEKMRECTTKLMKIGVECSKDNPRERMDVRDVNKELHLIRSHLLDDRTVEAASTSAIN
ncbi:hypothetical protein Syun_016707 [Stephania yunnanensis]|uniref:Uncharacterized protein n=1 Tax=Stephania yunnanensis TaxID=152371 RepID=A0AAP0J6I7_9MAGN